MAGARSARSSAIRWAWGSPRRWTPTWRCAASSGRSAAPCRTPTDGRPSGRSETVAALEFLRALYKESMTPEVFTWDPASNNRMMLAGRASFVCNAISVTRTAEKDNPELAKKIGLVPALQGPARRITAEHVMNCYVIWKFADNIDGAKKFLVDLVDVFPAVFQKSEFYNFPCYPSTVPDLDQLLANDPKADPRGKYTVLAGALDWATNVGYPGLRHRRHRRGLQHVRRPDHVRPRGARGADAPGRPRRGATGRRADIQEVGVGTRFARRLRPSRGAKRRGIPSSKLRTLENVRDPSSLAPRDDGNKDPGLGRPDDVARSGRRRTGVAAYAHPERGSAKRAAGQGVAGSSARPGLVSPKRRRSIAPPRTNRWPGSSARPRLAS